MRKRLLTLLLCICLLLVAGCGGDGISVGGIQFNGLKDNELLYVGEAVCPVAEAMIFVTSQKNIYQDSYGGDIWSVQLEDGTFESYILNELKDYMGRLFAAAEMAKASGMELTDEENAQISTAAAEYMSMLSASDVSAMGITEEIAVSTFEQYVLALKAYDSVMEQEAVEVSDDQARVIRIQRIFISTEGLDAAGKEEKRAKAQEAQDKLVNEGKDFVSVAETYNESEELDYEIARGQLPDSEEEAAYGLQSGTVSGLVETDNGFVIIKCVSSFEEAATAVNKEKLLESKKDQVFQEYLDGFLAEHPAVFNDKAWDKISISEYSGTASANFYTIYQKHFTEQ